jgi:hypothetical protein
VAMAEQGCIRPAGGSPTQPDQPGGPQAVRASVSGPMPARGAANAALSW